MSAVLELAAKLERECDDVERSAAEGGRTLSRRDQDANRDSRKLAGLIREAVAKDAAKRKAVLADDEWDYTIRTLREDAFKAPRYAAMRVESLRSKVRAALESDS